MDVERISSRQNPVVKRFRSAAEGNAERLLLDGVHLLDEALAAGLEVDMVAMVETGGHGAAHALAERAVRQGARLVTVTESVLAAMSPVRRPSGVVALARRRAVSLEAALQGAPQMVLMLADVQDPGNVGAVIRAAEGCGATGIVTSDGTADPFGWKALRGSMGSAFRLPVATRQPMARAIDAARAAGIRVHAAVPRSGTPLPRCDLRAGAAVLLGGEGAGLPPDLIEAADSRVTIPMRAPVESLNVATAAALIAYEAMRQRGESAA